ncbi:hypothetical protein BT63DRAFT_439101 [Microthyrium microscopicum]|uniref:F-box domain-containing protein n=1 Tax=Microthyrium microscopicum TaxID=703497 RepID=A0A6A6UCR1_9PEZI|nr:hypothetical protein BT63DRAFT_439101 [Microthyrium microscopicum]
MQASESSPVFNFLGLPRELQDEVITYMPIKSILRMRQTCRAFQDRIPLPTNRDILVANGVLDDPQPVHFCRGCNQFKDYHHFAFADFYHSINKNDILSELDIAKSDEWRIVPTPVYLIPKAAKVLWVPILKFMAKINYESWFLAAERQRCDICCGVLPPSECEQTWRRHIQLMGKLASYNCWPATSSLKPIDAITIQQFGQLFNRMHQIRPKMCYSVFSIAREGENPIGKWLNPAFSELCLSKLIWSQEMTEIVLEIFGPHN